MTCWNNCCIFLCLFTPSVYKSKNNLADKIKRRGHKIKGCHEQAVRQSLSLLDSPMKIHLKKCHKTFIRLSLMICDTLHPNLPFSYLYPHGCPKYRHSDGFRALQQRTSFPIILFIWNCIKQPSLESLLRL